MWDAITETPAVRAYVPIFCTIPDILVQRFQRISKYMTWACSKTSSVAYVSDMNVRHDCSFQKQPPLCSTSYMLWLAYVIMADILRAGCTFHFLRQLLSTQNIYKLCTYAFLRWFLTYTK